MTTDQSYASPAREHREDARRSVFPSEEQDREVQSNSELVFCPAAGGIGVFFSLNLANFFQHRQRILMSVVELG